MQRLILVIALSLTLSGCIFPFVPRVYKDYQPIDSPLIDMPKVAIVPVFDTSCQCLDWNISYEITQTVRQKILQDRNLYILDEEPMFRRVLRMRHFDLDDTCAKIQPLFCRAQYVVLVDIIQHDVIPYERQIHPELYCAEGATCAATLMMKARLTILDVRTQTPCIILDEIVNCNQTIPKEFEFCNYRILHWGCPYYEDTPCDRAHRWLAEVIGNRIQNVVWNVR